MEALAGHRLPCSRDDARPTRRGLALAAISAGFLMITLDATIVNVALGAIGADLGGAPSTAQWVVDGYIVAFASLILLAGSLADRIGVRKGFLVGLAVFVLASAACADAGSVAFLIAARVAQGLGAAWLMPCSLALIAHTYAEPQARRRALAVWGAVSGVGLACGPVIGGILVASVGWRAIFLANVPVGLAAAWLLIRNADERTVRRPLIDPAIFRNTTFATAVVVGFLFNFCLYGSIFCLAVALERLRGLGALETGFALLPMTAATAAMALLSGRLVPRLGEWPVLVAGLTSGAAGAALVALNGNANLGLLLICTVPIGCTALAMPAMMGLAIASAPGLGLGRSAGVFNTSRQAGGALGVAVLGSVLTAGGSLSLGPAFLLVACAYGLAVVLAASAARVSRRLIA
jgi:DHA2 family methylenomycin A resistance protein-like MFS transporter